MPTPGQPSTSTISADKLCAFTGLTDRRHRQLATEGYFPQPMGGMYQLAPTLTGMFKYYRTKQEAGSGGMAAAKLKKADANAREAEVNARKAEESVIDVPDAKRTMVRVAVIVKSKMMSIPSSAAPLIAGKSSAECEEKLRAMIIEALQELSEHKWVKQTPQKSKTKRKSKQSIES